MTHSDGTTDYVQHNIIPTFDMNFIYQYSCILLGFTILFSNLQLENYQNENLWSFR